MRSELLHATAATGEPAVSLVVVVHQMAREAPRTLFSLSADYQRGPAAGDHEVIVVDNGSSEPLPLDLLRGLRGRFEYHQVHDAPVSPAAAVNLGIARARGRLVGVMVDGARLATPGLLRAAARAAAVHPRAVVSTLGWYLGPDLQSRAAETSYTRAIEDHLLDDVDWRADGYRLFEIATLDESSVNGWYLPVAECCALFMSRELWAEHGGFDERFDLEGGGLVNLDAYIRACELPDSELVLALGEGTFHQLHGGTSTNATLAGQADYWRRAVAQYERIRGRSFAKPARVPVHVGRARAPELRHMARAAAFPSAAVAAAERPLGAGWDPALWRSASEATSSDTSPVVALVRLAQGHLAAGRSVECQWIARRAVGLWPLDTEAARLLRLTAGEPSPYTLPAERHAEVRCNLGDAELAIGHLEPAMVHYRLALDLVADTPRAHGALAAMALPGEDYLALLRRFHQHLRPRVYLEIGVFVGQSLALAAPPTRAVGVDPAPRASVPLSALTQLVPFTSDDFFARSDLEALLGGPVDLAFIDGLHTFDQALRDFANTEARARPGSIVLLHDTLPLDELTSTAPQRTAFYTGDVWKIVPFLRAERPDLTVFTIKTPPAGLTVVTGVDPRSGLAGRDLARLAAPYEALGFKDVQQDAEGLLALVDNDWDAILARIGGATTGAGRTEEIPASEAARAGRLDELTRQWLRLQWNHGEWRSYSWLGQQLLQLPADVLRLQEVLWSLRPRVIVETGVFAGGSSAFFATMCAMIGSARLISVERSIEPPLRDAFLRPPLAGRATLIEGDSASAGTVARVRELIQPGERVFVFLDSSHSREHVLAELEAYAPLVTPGSYIVAADGVMQLLADTPGGDPSWASDNPAEAVRQFAARHPEFELRRPEARFADDKVIETLTYWPGGWLRRRSASPGEAAPGQDP